MRNRQARSRRKGMFRWILEIKKKQVVSVCYREKPGEGIQFSLGGVNSGLREFV